MNKQKLFFHLLLIILIFAGLSANLYAADVNFEKGMAQYREENYEEALVLFEKAYKNNPNDPQAALYLGHTYREMQYYPEAVKYYKEALKLDPGAKDIKYLLADVLYGMGSYDEALSVIDEAINQGVKPAQSAYLKGLILAKLKRNGEASDSFKKAKELDPSLAQQADFQIAALYVQDKEYGKAKDIFKGLITKDPASDWALFSKDYLEALEKMPPPYRLNLGFGYQYDDNVLAVPTIQGLVDVTKQEDWKRIYNLFGEYTIFEKGPWNLKASYSLNIVQHNESDYPKTTAGQTVFSQDTVSHTISLMPSYNTEKGVFGLLLSYNNLSVDYTKYMESITVNPSYTFIIKGSHIGQVFAKYKRDEHSFEFLKIKFGNYSSNDEDKDADNIGGGIGYFYTFSNGNGLVSLKAEYDNNDADGANWDYEGVKGSAGLLYPFLDNKLKANIFAEIYRQDFRHNHTTYGKKRKDHTATLQTALTYTIIKPLDVSVGYTHIRDDSNIGVFDYKKNLYTLSFEYRF